MTPLITTQQLAQEMLDRYGFFLLGSWKPKEVGVYKTNIVSGTARFEATYRIVGEATTEDRQKQTLLINEVYPPGAYVYRAVAE